MKIPKSLAKAPRGSALLTVLFFTVIIGIVTVSLLSFAMQKRRDTARMVIYNEELTAAERALDRFIAQVYFVSVNRVPQVSGINTNGFAGFIASGMGSVADDKFNIGVVSQPVQQNLRTNIDDAIIADIPEVAQWRNYTIVLDSYRIVAGAIAYRDSGLALAGDINRDGVYVTNSITYYQVPLLNYAIFYEPTLELDGGARIDIYGKVHTNDDWYLTSSSSVGYHDYNTVAGNFYGGIYNPLDGERRGWWSGSRNIEVAKVGPASVGGAATQMDTIYDSNINVNNDYLASAIYNPSSPANGNPSVDFNYVDSTTKQWGAQGPEDWWDPNPDWVDMSQDMFNGFLRDQQHGVEKIKLPIGEASDPYVLIEPPLPSGRGSLPADDNVQKKSKLAYKASVIFEVTGTGWTNDSTFLNNVKAYRLVPDSTAADGYRKDYFSLTYKKASDSATAPPRTFLSHSVIYNGREEADVHTIDIDMVKLAEYLNTSNRNADPNLPRFTLQRTDPGSVNGVMYVNIPQDSTLHGADFLPDNANQIISGRPNGIGTQGAVRVLNGKDLTDVLSNTGIHPTNGLTLATNSPLYTKGDLNAPNNEQDRIPLLLACDSINPLSNNFNDSNYDPRTNPSSSSFKVDGPKNSASNTKTNAVFLTGNVPTKYRQYGGGAENFYRYIENWGGKTHYYRGSMLNMFHSKIATDSWDKNTGTGTSSGYYGAPRRDWGWDENFANGNEPPGMPSTFQYAIGRWELSNESEYLSYPNAVALTLRNKP
ncbi:MAG: hypothetical protein PWP23_3310 [Candidatus Sumerlaeota bacterium]|nr:hypothetical protein [Candidatus Sumerlaeota bacterium]